MAIGTCRELVEQFYGAGILTAFRYNDSVPFTLNGWNQLLPHDGRRIAYEIYIANEGDNTANPLIGNATQTVHTSVELWLPGNSTTVIVRDFKRYGDSVTEALFYMPDINQLVLSTLEVLLQG